MLNLIWPGFIICSVLFAIITGRADQINSSIFSSAADAVKMTITFFGTMCLWNGLMKIVQETSIMNKLCKLIRPVMKILFPEMKKEDQEYKEITVNIVANLLGLGNAATPLGLKAMNSLQKKNPKKDTLSDSMAMFIVINTASMQIIPSTVIAIRASLNSYSPCSVILPILIATIASNIAGVTATKIMLKKF